MTALEKMREFVASFPDWDVLGELAIDYADRIPNTAGLFPSGLVPVRRRTDLLGNVETDDQYNFALYTVLGKSPGEDAGATLNAEWVMAFQQWVQEQSALGLAPTFGDYPRRERLVAQNGAIYSADPEGTAVYVIQITASFTKRHERG